MRPKEEVQFGMERERGKKELKKTGRVLMQFSNQ
jgi:hypothetical protein